MNKKYSLYYVTSNEGKYREAYRFLQEYAPSIDLIQHTIELEELQSLNEQEVLKHKALQARNSLKKPLLIDDAGLYLNAYPRFPGTLAKPVLDTLGYKGIASLTAKDDQVEFFVGIAYVDALGTIHYFRGSTQGHIILQALGPVHYSFQFYAHFKPDNFSKTYAEIWNDSSMRHLFARVRALKYFVDWLNKQ